MEEMRYETRKKSTSGKLRKFSRMTCKKCECKQKVWWPLSPRWKCNICGEVNDKQNV